MGYGVDESSTVLDGLFCFEHESWEFDEDQDANELLIHMPSLRELNLWDVQPNFRRAELQARFPRLIFSVDD
jgi:hypothetical protein